MKITYTEDPLATIVLLDPVEQEVFRQKIKVEVLEWALFGAEYHLKKDPPEVEKALKELNTEYHAGEEVNKRVDEMLAHYIEELKGYHVGDCTCVACSCSKCHAESILGIDTIKGLGKHPGHKIASVFSRWDPKTKEHSLPPVSIDDALEALRTYEPKADWPGWEAHTERWKEEGRQAYEWLLNYKKVFLEGANGT